MAADTLAIVNYEAVIHKQSLLQIPLASALHFESAMHFFFLRARLSAAID